MAGLRVGINALYLLPGEVGGTEIYLRNLLRGLAAVDAHNQYFVFVNSETDALLNAEAPGFQFVECPVKARFRPARILFEQFLLPGLLKKHRVDVLLNPGFTMPVFAACPCVTVFHDLQHKRHPGFFRKADLLFWNLLLWLAAIRSRSLIAVSQATADDLAKYYPNTLTRIAVIPHGVDPEFFRIGERRKTNEPDPEKYLLVVSTLHPHKNLDRLMEAFKLFRASHSQYRLIVAGLRGFAANDLESKRGDLGLEESVFFTGWVTRERLYELFEHADAYIAPSRFEGFGMPIIEALAAGIPSACSDIPPMNQNAGPAAVLFDPDSVSAMAGAMELIATDADFRSRAALAGPERARQFDWNTAAEMTLRELSNAVSRPALEIDSADS